MVALTALALSEGRAKAGAAVGAAVGAAAAEPKGADLISLAEISKREDISLPYLEQLFVKLRRAGLVEAVRGPGGGYRLARSPDSIRVSEVLEALLANDIAVETGVEGGTRESAALIAAFLSPEVRIESRSAEKHERRMVVGISLRHDNLRSDRIVDD